MWGSIRLVLHAQELAAAEGMDAATRELAKEAAQVLG